MEAPTKRNQTETLGAKVVIERDVLQSIIIGLASRGFRVIGPTTRDGAIVYENIARLEDLPVGWTDRQDAGQYRLERRADQALFGYAVGPHSWKRFLHPPVEVLWRAHREGDGFSIVEKEEITEPLAFIGVRACELRAIAIQDRVFLAGQYLDKSYKIRRDHAFIVAVNCSQAGGTCFCVSMDAGPRVEAGFDLALTELVEEGHHLLVMELGSAAGVDLVRDFAAPARNRGGNRRRRTGCRPNPGSDGAHPRNKRAQGIAAGQPEPSAVGRGRRTLPHMR